MVGHPALEVFVSPNGVSQNVTHTAASKVIYHGDLETQFQDLPSALLGDDGDGGDGGCADRGLRREVGGVRCVVQADGSSGDSGAGQGGPHVSA